MGQVISGDNNNIINIPAPSTFFKNVHYELCIHM